MKKLLGAVIGGSIGFITPLVLAVGNETLFIKKQLDNGSQIWDAVQICAFERRWFPLYPKVIHAPGCQNKTLGILPGLLLLSTPAGLAIGAILSKDKRSSRRTSDVNSQDSSQITESVAASVPDQTPDPVERSLKDAPKPSLPSIAPQVSQGLEQLKEINWVKAGAGAAVAGVVAIVGVGTINLLKGGSSPGEGLNPFRQKVQRQYYVVEGYSKPFVKESRKSITFEPVSTTKEVCRSKKDNAIDQSELTEILSNGGRVITQGGEVGQEVDSGFTFENYGWKVYVNCFYIPYIIEE